jgi:Bacterial PH domain
VFRSPAAVAVWYVWLVFAVLNLADLAWQGGGHAAVVAAAVILLVTGVAYVAALRPRVIASEDALTVRNPLRDTRVPWTAVTSIDLGDSLRVRCGPERVVHCWAVQSSRRSRLRAQYRAQSREAQAARRTPGYGRMPAEARSRLTQSTGEIIASQLSDRAEEARDRGTATGAQAGAATATGPATGPVTGPATSGGTGDEPAVTWCWTAVAALAVPAVLVVLAILVR